MIHENPDHSFDVELVHPNGERKRLPVEAIFRRYITVRWSLSGLYEIDAKRNTMRSQNPAARRRGRCDWMALDIESVRRLIREHFGDSREEQREETYQRHHQNMPYRKT